MCVHSRALWVSPRDPPVRLGSSPTTTTPTAFNSQRCLKLYPPVLEPWVAWFVLLLFFFPAYPQANVGNPVIHPPPAHPSPLWPCSESSQLWLPSAPHPHISLDECFFFNSLVGGLAYSSIFWQSWLLLFLNCCCPCFGCTWRQSVSTQASILAGRTLYIQSKEQNKQNRNIEYQL